MKIPPGLKYLVLAGLLAIVATYLIHQYIAFKTQGEVRRLGQIVVAEVDIPPGTVLADRMLKIAQWPDEIIPKTGIRDPKQAVGRVVQMAISRGEPLLAPKLAPEGTAAGLGGLVDLNKLAVTVRTDDVSGVAGFINPGDRVDILVEMPSPSLPGEHFSKIILQNIKVLSKGQSTEQSPEKKPEVVTTVTLELTPDQAEILNLASFQGKIRLALRNRLNQAEFATSGVLSSQIASRPSIRVTVPPSPQKPKEERTIDIIKGAERFQVTY